jgi:hypothetical protein
MAKRSRAIWIVVAFAVLSLLTIMVPVGSLRAVNKASSTTATHFPPPTALLAPSSWATA